VELLLFADVGDDRLEVFFAEAGNAGHVAEGPVVLGDAAECGEDEGDVAVAVRFVDDGQVEGPLSVPRRSAP